MPIENFNLIKDLDLLSPAGSDQALVVDDHIRGVKATLKNQFPNLEAPVTVTAAQINSLPSALSAITSVNNSQNEKMPIAGGTFTGAVVAPSFTTPPGGFINTASVRQLGVPLIQRGSIIMWYGSPQSIPTGWVLCDGLNGTPDMRDCVVIGAAGGYPVYSRGGTAIHNINTAAAGAHSHGGAVAPAGSHDHGGRAQPVTLTYAQMPTHAHLIGSEGDGSNGITNTGAGQPRSPGVGSGPSIATSPEGGSQPHDHPISLSGDHQHGVVPDGQHTHSVSFDNRPPFVALCFIMYTVAN